MKKRYLALTVGAITLAINLMIPACGSKNNISSPYATGFACTTGQVCTGVSGTPMFPSAVMTSVDNYGSMAQIQIYASGYTAGASTTQVSVQAQVYIAPGAYPCGGGTFYVQGTGNWVPNYGGSLGLVQAQLTGSNGFAVQMNGEVYQGQDPALSQASQFYYRGNFGNYCDQNSIAL